MPESKKALYYRLAIEGLVSANRGSVFWTKRDAMQAINLARK